MKRIFCFSEKTFQTLTKEHQHKKCAELLKEIVCQKNAEELRSEYAKLCSWIGLQGIEWDDESIEHRFHDHMRQAGRSVLEHDFLCHLTIGDKESISPWLSIYTFLDGLRSCHNVGSIIRTVECFRLGPVHLSSDMMLPDHPQIQKTSMGAWKYVQIFHGTLMENLPRPWIALETVQGAPAYNEMLYPELCTLIVGNEERGIHDSLLKECDSVVTIPIVGSKNSLNVANAFAIVAAEVASQQRR